MSASEGVIFSYSVKDINGTIRQTNSMLRALNAVRVLTHVLQEFWRKPTLANMFWAIIQVSRIYNSLKRINRLLQQECNISLGFIKGLGQIPIIDIPDTPEISGGLDPLTMSVDIHAFRENIPMGLEGIDISDLPEKSRRRLQEIFEDDAEMTVTDARQILRSRIIHPDRSTGNLERSIGWQPQVFGTRIVSDAFYSWWVERGHHTFTGHWFLTDATARAKERLPLRIKAELDAILKEGK